MLEDDNVTTRFFVFKYLIMYIKYEIEYNYLKISYMYIYIHTDIVTHIVGLLLNKYDIYYVQI